MNAGCARCCRLPKSWSPVFRENRFQVTESPGAEFVDRPLRFPKPVRDFGGVEAVDELQSHRFLVLGPKAADRREDRADHFPVGGCAAGGTGVGGDHVEEAEGVALVEGPGDTTPAAAAFGGAGAADGIKEAVVRNGDEPPLEGEEPGGSEAGDGTEDGEEGLLEDVFGGDDAGEGGGDLALEAAEEAGLISDQEAFERDGVASDCSLEEIGPRL